MNEREKRPEQAITPVLDKQFETMGDERETKSTPLSFHSLFFSPNQRLLFRPHAPNALIHDQTRETEYEDCGSSTSKKREGMIRKTGSVGFVQTPNFPATSAWCLVASYKQTTDPLVTLLLMNCTHTHKVRTCFLHNYKCKYVIATLKSLFPKCWCSIEAQQSNAVSEKFF